MKKLLELSILLLFVIVLVFTIKVWYDFMVWKPSDVKIEYKQPRGTLPTTPIYEDYEGKG